VTPDRRYFVVRGKLWRISDPDLDPREKSRPGMDLMAARRAVKDAKGAGDHGAENAAHRMVDEARHAATRNHVPIASVSFASCSVGARETGAKRRCA
jgi:hypothetical protein